MGFLNIILLQNIDNVICMAFYNKWHLIHAIDREVTPIFIGLSAYVFLFLRISES